MKKILIAMITLLITSNCFAEDSRITDIRKEYYKIQNSLKKMSVLKMDINGRSAEGGVAKAYLDKNLKILHIQEDLYGEGGKIHSLYYFKDGRLFFVFIKAYIYNAPIYMNESRAKQMGIEAFNIKKSEITENRYYFSDGRIIRWIDKDSKTHSSYGKGDKLLKEANSLYKKMKDHIKKQSK